MTWRAIGSKLLAVACGFAQLWPSSRSQPKPPFDCLTSRSICAAHFSGVPITPSPDSVDEVDHFGGAVAEHGHLREGRKSLKVTEPMIMPYCTSAIACSLVSAQCIGPTRRQFERSTVLPCTRASSPSTSQCSARASKPAAVVAPTERSPMPCRLRLAGLATPPPPPPRRKADWDTAEDAAVRLADPNDGS